MTARALSLANLWANPVFQRYRRSRLRLRKSVFWYLLVLVVTTFQSLLTYILETNRGQPPVEAARDLWIGLIVIQGLILMIKGTGAVSAGLIQDKLDETLDYQRLTPMSPLRSLVGYLFGLPVQEYAMFALTLPYLAFIVIAGEIPLATVGSVYLAFFTCVVLYHTMGIAAGMVMQRWIWGYLLSIFLVVFVNVILPGLISQVGLKFLQYLSVWPVIGQKVLPLVVPANLSPQATAGNPFLSPADSVPFYNWTLTPFVFTLALQSALIVTFATMALRRWTSATRHPLSKPYALAFLAGFIVLLIGNIWPAITGQYLPFPIFGVRSLEQLEQPIAIALPLMYCLVIWLLGLMLYGTVLPSHDAYVRGIRRAMKRGRRAAQPWEDDAAGGAFVALYVVTALAGFGVLHYEISAAGFLDFLIEAGFGFWRLPLVLALVLPYTALLVLVLERKPTNLAILLVWFVPILAATVLSAATESFQTLHAVIASVSPLGLLLMTGLLPTQHLGAPPEGQFLSLATGVYWGLAFLALQIAVLAWRWRVIQRQCYAFCEAGGTQPTGGSAPDLAGTAPA